MMQAASAPLSAPASPVPSARTAAPSGPAVGGQGPLQREVFGYAFANSALNDPTVGYPSWNFSLLSTVAFFGLHVECDGVKCDGTFAQDSAWSVWNSSMLSGMVSAAHAAGTKVVVSIVLQEFAPPTPAMCGGLMFRSATVTQTVNEVLAKGVDGVNVDYEGVQFGNCANGQSPRAMFTDFISQLRTQLNARAGGRNYLSIASYASAAGDPGGFFDIGALNAFTDSFFVMAYDMEYTTANWQFAGCSQFCLGPTSPLGGYPWNATRAIGEYVKAIPASKVILGVPYYGRKACVQGTGRNGVPLAGTDPNNVVVADPYSVAVTESQGTAGFASGRDPLDPVGRERLDTWPSSLCTSGQSRELYWDDTASLGAKYDLVNGQNLRGAGLFALNYGGGAPELWSSLAGHFTTLPGAPTNVAADGQNGSATVSWVPPASNGPAITSYTVVASPGGATSTVSGGSHWTTVTGLTNGTAYSFTVLATNATGNGPSSGPSNPATPTAAGRHRSYFAEGTTHPGFQEYLTFANTGTADATATINYEFGNGGASMEGVSIPAHSRATVDVNQFVGPWQDVAVVIDSASGGLAVERPMYFNTCLPAFCMNGGHVATATQPATEWDFAEGYTGVGFQEYLTLQNPGTTAANVTINYLFVNGPPKSQTLSLKAGSRSTVDVNGVIGPWQQVGAQVLSDVPIVAERPMYFNACLALCFDGGHVAAGARAATSFNFAEGHTGNGLVEYLVLSNPGSTAANVSVTYQFAAGQGPPLSRAYSVPAQGRTSITVDDEVGAGKDVSISLNANASILAERPMYFNFPRGGQTQNGGHDAQGTTPHPTWYFAEGFTAPGFQTLLSLQNPGGSDAQVTIAYALGSGATSTQSVTVPPNSRTTVDVNSAVGPGQQVSATVSSNQPIVAERPMYFNACPGLCMDGGSDTPGAFALP